MKRINSRNTKSEILDAYDELLAEYKLLQKEAKKKTSIVEVTANAEEHDEAPVINLDVEGFLNSLASLRSGFGQCANGLQRQLTHEAVKLHDILSDANQRSLHLRTLHDIDIDETTLARLIKQYHEQNESFTVEIEANKTEFETRLNEDKKLWAEEKSHRNITVTERANRVNMARKREGDEYTYERDMTRQLEKDAYQRLKTQRESALEVFQDEADQRWDKREEAMAEREMEHDTLLETVAEFDERLKSARDQAKAEGTNIAKRQTKIESDMLGKEHEGKRRVYELQITALEDTINKQAEQLLKLTKQLSTAQTQAQELAVKALEGAAHSTSFTAVREIAMEQAKHTKGK